MAHKNKKSKVNNGQDNEDYVTVRLDWFSKILIAVAIIGAVVLGYKIFGFGQGNGGSNNNVNVPIQSLDGVTVVNLSFDTKTYNYSPSVIRVKSGDNVRIVADPSIPGCYKFFQIPQLKISKYFDSGDNILEFVAPAPGRYTYTCSMGMGQGVLIVE